MTAAGWYADPTRRHPLRYWDGTQWTDHVSQGPGAPPMRDPLSSSAPPGWYPDPSGGGRRYWDGDTWTQHVAASGLPGAAHSTALRAPSFLTRRHMIAGGLTLVATSLDAGLLRLIFFGSGDARSQDDAGFLVATFASSVTLSFLIFLVTVWPAKRPHAAAVTGAAILCALVLSGVAPAQDVLDQPFGSPHYLVHAIRGDQQAYFLLNFQPRADGTFEIGDGTGGTYGYDSDYVSGPLDTPREACEALADRDALDEGIAYGAAFSCAGTETSPTNGGHEAEPTSAGHDLATVLLGLFWTPAGAATGLGGAAVGGGAAFAFQRFGWRAIRRLLPF